MTATATRRPTRSRRRDENGADLRVTTDTTTSDGTAGSGAIDDADGSGVPNRIAEQFENIKRTRRRRALGWTGLLAFLAFATLQAFAATELLNPDARLETFTESLTGFFPITNYFGVIPFLDFGQYIQFIRQENLLYDPEIGRLLFQFPRTRRTSTFLLPGTRDLPDIRRGRYHPRDGVRRDGPRVPVRARLRDARLRARHPVPLQLHLPRDDVLHPGDPGDHLDAHLHPVPRARSRLGRDRDRVRHDREPAGCSSTSSKRSRTGRSRRCARPGRASPRSSSSGC